MRGLYRSRNGVEGGRYGADGRLSLHRLSRKAPRPQAKAERLSASSIQYHAGDRATDRATGRNRVMEFTSLVTRATPSVALDAIEPANCVVQETSERHLPAEQFEVLKAAEKSERAQEAAMKGASAQACPSPGWG